MSYVARICNLLYRRFVIGKASAISSVHERSGGPQNAILRYGRLQICATLAFLTLTIPVYAASLSDPAVDAYNARIGTQTFSGQYKFTTNTLLVETAQAITNFGSDTIK